MRFYGDICYGNRRIYGRFLALRRLPDTLYNASMTDPQPMQIRGRGSAIRPPNRFERIHVEDDWEQLDGDSGSPVGPRKVATEYFEDDSQSIVTENNSPDVGFRYSLNPYRGCSHGCSYCYARPTHEYFNLSAGLDFETKIFVKRRAPELLRRWLARPGWKVEPIILSGVTDCYQPAERELRITRGCLQVACDARQPICIITKNALVTRDLDLLQEMAAQRLVTVAISVTTLDPQLGRLMEPRTSSPLARLKALETLTRAGVPAKAMLAPVIPGLTDSEIPSILAAVRDAGAISAGYVLLRLPHSVRPVFLEWLERTHPEQQQRVESRIRGTREGRLNDPRFGTRMRGSGPLADQIHQTFSIFAHKFGLDGEHEPLNNSLFRPPALDSGQQWLF